MHSHHSLLLHGSQWVKVALTSENCYCNAQQAANTLTGTINHDFLIKDTQWMLVCGMYTCMHRLEVYMLCVLGVVRGVWVRQVPF